MKFTAPVILAALMLTICAAGAHAAGAPPLIDVQGRLTDAGGVILPDGTYSVTFKIAADTAGAGIPLHSETQNVVVTGGLFSAVVGRMSALSPAVFTNGSTRFLILTVAGNPQLPSVRFNSVGFAQQSVNADVATLALNVTCVGCVDAGEIAAGAVGSSEVSDASLSSVDLLDEPGVANHKSAVGTPLNTVPQNLLSRNIIAPAAGYVLVIATVNVSMIASQTESRSCDFGVSTQSGTFANVQRMSVRVPSSQVEGSHYQIVTMHGLFATSGGSDTFYLLGESFSDDFVVYERQLSLIYFPTAHGTVVVPATQFEGELGSEERSHRDATSAVNFALGARTRVDASTDTHEDQAHIITEMEVRIQRLEEKLKQLQTINDENR